MQQLDIIDSDIRVAKEQLAAKQEYPNHDWHVNYTDEHVKAWQNQYHQLKTKYEAVEPNRQLSLF